MHASFLLWTSKTANGSLHGTLVKGKPQAVEDDEEAELQRLQAEMAM